NVFPLESAKTGPSRGLWTTWIPGGISSSRYASCALLSADCQYLLKSDLSAAALAMVADDATEKTRATVRQLIRCILQTPLDGSWPLGQRFANHIFSSVAQRAPRWSVHTHEP